MLLCSRAEATIINTDRELTVFFVRLSLVLVSLKLPVRTISAAGLSACVYDGPRTIFDRSDLAFFFSVFDK